jgi:hypothetical protein
LFHKNVVIPAANTAFVDQFPWKHLADGRRESAPASIANFTPKPFLSKRPITPKEDGNLCPANPANTNAGSFESGGSTISNGPRDPNAVPNAIQRYSTALREQSNGLTRPAGYCLIARRNERNSYDKLGLTLRKARPANQPGRLPVVCSFFSRRGFRKNADGPEVGPVRTEFQEQRPLRQPASALRITR